MVQQARAMDENIMVRTSKGKTCLIGEGISNQSIQGTPPVPCDLVVMVEA